MHKLRYNDMKIILEDTMNTLFTVIATNTTDTATGCDTMTFVTYALMFAIIIGLFWFMNRKQKKQEQETQDMRNSLRVGDEVTTIGGIIGRVVSVKDETVVIETSRDGTKIRFLKSAISRVDVTAEDAQASKEKPAVKEPEVKEPAPEIKEDKKEKKEKKSRHKDKFDK